MVSMNDYENFGNGFGLGSTAEVAELSKALNTGDYSQYNGVEARTDGAPLIVESLENSLKVLTFSQENIKFWKKIPKLPAYSNVEEYNQLLSYGQSAGGFVPEGILPETEDSEYRRQAAFVKFIGTTREVTHVMATVRTAHGDVIARENQNGILWIMRQLEQALFWGNRTLAPAGQEGLQFDGLDRMVDPANTIDLRGRYLQDTDINHGAELILQNFGFPTDLYLPFEVLGEFSNTYFPKERVIMPTANNGYQAGLVVNQFQSHGGPVEFNPDLFLTKTKPLNTTGTGGTKAPTAPATLAVALSADVVPGSQVTATDAGTYNYAVTAANRFGESVPVTATAAVAITDADIGKAITVTITNSATMVVAPEWFSLYRTEKDGTAMFKIADIPAASVNASGVTPYNDLLDVMANTYTAFMGEMTPETIAFKQLLPIFKMNLATLGPAIRWMIFVYGVPVIYAPKKWMRFRNIKANTPGNAQLYAR